VIYMTFAEKIRCESSKKNASAEYGQKRLDQDGRLCGRPCEDARDFSA
jgi:hypothetical protein